MWQTLYQMWLDNNGPLGTGLGLIVTGVVLMGHRLSR